MLPESTERREALSATARAARAPMLALAAREASGMNPPQLSADRQSDVAVNRFPS